MAASHGLPLPLHLFGLRGDCIIQATAPQILELARSLDGRDGNDVDFIHSAFEWVRDEVAHSYDAQDPRVTLTATQVLND